MNERDFFNEKEEVKKATYSCPHCRERGEYDVRWLKRTKKQQPPRGMNEQDRARFQKSRDYLVRIDDMLACRNARCRRRFDVQTEADEVVGNVELSAPGLPPVPFARGGVVWYEYFRDGSHAGKSA